MRDHPPKFRIAIVGTRGVPARYGGFETLAEVLKTRLEDVHIEVWIPTMSISLETRPRRRAYRYFETIIGTLRSLKSVTGIDRILVVNPANITVAVWLLLRGVRVAIHMDGRDDLRPKWPMVVRKSYRVAQWICVFSKINLVFDSNAVRRELCPKRERQVHVVAYGGCISCESSRKFWKSKESTRKYLVLGRAEPENQLVKIVDAFIGQKLEACLLVVATSRYRDEYWTRLQLAAGNQPSVRLIEGMWDRSELCKTYRTVSAVIHGHSVGGTNPSLILALCHGTPVLAHDNPYNREVAGSLARYWKTEKELTKLLDEFDPSTWPYDQAAVDDFNRRYNWDDVVEKYKRVLGIDQSSSDGPLDRK